MLAQVAFPWRNPAITSSALAVVRTFVNNGLTQADDIHAVNLEKLYDIFRADAFSTCTSGSTAPVQVVVSDTQVTLDGQLVDLRSGEQLWNGTAASSTEQHGTNQGGLAELLAQALVEQIVHSVADATMTSPAWPTTGCSHAGQPHGLL